MFPNLNLTIVSCLVSIFTLGCVEMSQNGYFITIGTPDTAYNPFYKEITGDDQLNLRFQCSVACTTANTTCDGFNFLKNGTFVCQLFKIDPTVMAPARNQPGGTVWLKIRQNKNDNGEHTSINMTYI